MQKFIKGLVGFALMALTVLPANSFAQEEEESKGSLNWSAWGRTIFVPAIDNHDGETVPRDVTSWGWGTRLGFTLKGESEYVGFRIDMRADDGDLGGCQDEQKVWAKPIDFLTVEAGPNVFYDALRGNATFGSWNWMRFNGIRGEDNIFERGQAGGGDGTRNSNAKAGSIIHLDKGAIHVFAAFNVLEEEGNLIRTDTVDAAPDIVTLTDQNTGNTYTIDRNEGLTESTEVREQYTTSLMLQRGQYGFGYEIEDIGMVRAQYIGKSYLKDPMSDELESYGVINAAVKLDKLVENLYVDFGFFTPTDDDNTKGDNTRVAVYANYKMGSITPHFLCEAEMDKEYVKDGVIEEDTGLKLGVGVDVDLGDGLSVVTDFRFHNEAAVATQDVDNQVAYLVGIKKGFSNGNIGIGFQGTNHDFGDGVVTKEEADDFAWAIPVTIEYSF